MCSTSTQSVDVKTDRIDGEVEGIIVVSKRKSINEPYDRVPSAETVDAYGPSLLGSKKERHPLSSSHSSKNTFSTLSSTTPCSPTTSSDAANAEMYFYSSPGADYAPPSWLIGGEGHLEKFPFVSAVDLIPALVGDTEGDYTGEDYSSYYSESDGLVDPSDSDMALADQDGSSDFVGPDGKPILVEGASLALAEDGMPFSFPCFAPEEAGDPLNPLMVCM